MRTETIGAATLYLGDCRDIIPTLPLIDQFLFSPPYNLGTTAVGSGGFPGKKLGHYADDARGKQRGGMGKWSGGLLSEGYGAFDDAMSHDEYRQWQKDIVRACWLRLSAFGAIYYNHKPRVLNGVLVTPFVYLPDDLPIRQVIIWARAGGINFSSAFYCPTHEWITVIAKPEFRLRDKAASGAGDTWYIAQENNTEHPAPFPVELASRAIWTTSAQVICDPFMGSGTTGVAALRWKRKFYGIEKELRWFDLSCRRIEEAARQDDLFANPESA